MSEKWDKAKQYAAQLADLDRHIVEIVAIENPESKEKNVNLVRSFEPEPSDDCIGFFWIASLMVRIEYESLDERLDVQFIYYSNGENIVVSKNPKIKLTH